ncbi:MAG TPA: BTAD domain-containing putative transcriptional regulator [Acidimicrobiales bacterium]|nr:BTAD domain-containing putative transcriptional regulator [Acidimicrobiales bacterium]
MESASRALRSRRAPEPPAPVPDELVRAPLLDAAARRFDAAVTTVVAGAGFGKTTLLAQAVRANVASPRGVDAWVSCQPGDEDPAQLAAVIAAALGAEPGGGSPLQVALGAIVDAGPVDVCLVIDDLHELPEGCGAVELLSDLVRRRPTHLHLLLAGRRPPPLPLARLRATGDVVEVAEADLAFTDAEVDALAGSATRAERARGLAGWPSLVRLAVSAPATATSDFVWQEVTATLPGPQRIGLLALATLGGGDAEDIARVADVPVDAAALAAHVPLVTIDDAGHLRAHDLWEGVIAEACPPDAVARIRRRAVDVLIDRGDIVRAGWCARRWRDAGLLTAPARALVRATLGSLPIETATRWLAGLGDAADAHPDLALLQAAIRQSRRPGELGIDADVDALVATYADAGDADGQAVALALGAVAAHFRGDLVRVFCLAARVREVPGASDDPFLGFLVGAVDAGLAALQGDVDGALAAIGALPRRGVDRRTAEVVSRLEVAMLLLAGRADEAADVARDTLADAPSAYVRLFPGVVRWMAGDPSAMRGVALSTCPDADTNERDRLYHAAYGTSVLASLGDRPGVDGMWPIVSAWQGGALDARDSALVVGAVATRRVLEHDDAGAGAALAAHVASHPLAVPASELHLRRVLPVAYVLDDDARRHWDGADLGPTHVQARAIARALLAARAGDPPSPLPASPDAVMTTLPLPWSVELATRAEAARPGAGIDLVAGLADWAGDAVRAELERLAGGDSWPDAGRRTAAGGAMDVAGADGEGGHGGRGHVGLCTGARRLLDVLAAEGGARVRIELLGPARVLIDGTPVDAPHLRRGRVRTLLALLAVSGPLRREQIVEAMWPDHDPARGARNLRVILSRLRQVLEPGSVPGILRPVLLADGDIVALADTGRVELDVRELDRLLAEAERAHAAGDATARAEHLAGAVALWRDEPLVDLEPLAGWAGDVEAVRRSLVEAALRLGEVRLAAGRTDEALVCAERARSASPYDERAHRLVMATQLQRRDRAGALAAVDVTEAMLDDIGVPPEDATAMVIRQVRHRHPTAAPAAVVDLRPGTPIGTAAG